MIYNGIYNMERTMSMTKNMRNINKMLKTKDLYIVYLHLSFFKTKLFLQSHIFAHNRNIVKQQFRNIQRREIS